LPNVKLPPFNAHQKILSWHIIPPLPGNRLPTQIPWHALQPLIDKVANHLSFWMGQLMNHSGRLALIKTTLSATSTHLAINLGLPPWFLKALEKIMKGFLWSGTDSVQGGKCLVAWGCVQRPLELGGLGILDPKLFGQALRVRWLWLQFADPDHYRSALPCPEDPTTVAFFYASTRVVLGNSLIFGLTASW
jgi:hypothetical protein